MNKYLTFMILATMVACNPKTQDTSFANLFAPGNVNTHMGERDAALSPDGRQFFFSVQLNPNYSTICFAEKYRNKWGRPLVAPFSGKFMDIEPVFHPDGRLFFVSNRPMPGEQENGDFNIWYVNKENNTWSEPVALDSIINSEGNEFYPSFTNDGTIYFTASKPKGKGGEDLWYAKLINNQYQSPVNMGDSINTSSFEYNSFVHPHGDFILFTTHGWGEGLGSGDIFVSFHKQDDSWTRPINLGEKVNTKAFEYCPSLSPDGKLLFFSRKNIAKPEEQKWGYFEMMSHFSSMENGQGAIYYLDAEFIENLKP